MLLANLQPTLLHIPTVRAGLSLAPTLLPLLAS
jgi:hypothetical protein